MLAGPVIFLILCGRSRCSTETDERAHVAEQHAAPPMTWVDESLAQAFSNVDNVDNALDDADEHRQTMMMDLRYALSNYHYALLRDYVFQQFEIDMTPDWIRENRKQLLHLVFVGVSSRAASCRGTLVGFSNVVPRILPARFVVCELHGVFFLYT